MHNVMIALYHLSLQLLSDHCHTNSSPFDYVLPTSFPGRLLARVLKEGVQFWYNDTSTVRGGGGGGSRKRSSGKPLMFTLLHVSICSKLVRKFSNTLGFVSLCRYVVFLIMTFSFSQVRHQIDQNVKCVIRMRIEAISFQIY